MTGPYGRWIADYRDGGLHPFPVEGKRPCVTAYAKRRPSAAATVKWAQAFPAANLGLPTRRERLAVLDADDPDAVALFEAIVGATPLRVRTRRGEHWYYADPANEIAGAIHPQGQPFDIKAAGSADYVLAPGSEHQGLAYEIIGYDGDDPIGEFARRLRDLPRFSASARNDLVQQPRGLVQARPSLVGVAAPILLSGAVIPQGARNAALFKAACRDAHELRRRHGDGDEGLAALTNQAAAFNSALCSPLLEDHEVDKLADGVWKRTLAGVNRPPARKNRHVRGVLQRLGREVRSLALWGWLSQSGFDIDDIELAPARVAAAIPGWKPHDAEAAINGLVGRDVLRQVRARGRGRGNAGRYQVRDPLVSQVSFAASLHTLGGDAAALALLAFLVDTWGADARAPISAEGMSQTVGGPFGGWTKVKILRARDRLEAAGLIERLEVKRRGVRRPRALFQVRAAAVLKIPEIVPVDIHRPLGLLASEAQLQQVQEGQASVQ